MTIQNLRRAVLLWSLALISISIYCQSVQITEFPGYGQIDLLKGKSDISNPGSYGVVCYVFVQEAGGWWGPKPSFEHPVTPLNPDGTFSLQFITGGYDEFCTRIFVYLKPNSLPDPPHVEGNQLPSALFNYPHDMVARPHGSRKIFWPDQEHRWTVKESIASNTMGPGDNLFSASTENVWIDGNEELHLKIDKRDGLYYSSEIIADTSFGYGKYSFVYNSNPNILDPKSVFGFFTWDDIGPYAQNPNDYYREIDFEFSRWGNPNDVTNAQFVIQPWEPTGNLMRYNAGTAPGTIHSFAWYKDSVVFESRRPDSSIIKKWKYTGYYLPDPGEENIRINLWLNNKPPLIEDEIILGNYGFQYHLQPPSGIAATDGIADTCVFISWNYVQNRFYQVFRSETQNSSNATALANAWFQGNSYTDRTAAPGVIYYYWLRCADNPSGSNITGYISGFSVCDSGFISLKHTVQLNGNWSSLSSFIDPVDDNLDSIVQKLGNDFIILQTLSGIYYPAMGINSIGAWNSDQGYMIKTAQQNEVTFSGLPHGNNSISLSSGWNLIPVPVSCPVVLVDMLVGINFQMIIEAAGTKLYWPAMGLHSLTTLIPGKGYLIKMSSPGIISFPDCSGINNQ